MRYWIVFTQQLILGKIKFHSITVIQHFVRWIWKFCCLYGHFIGWFLKLEEILCVSIQAPTIQYAYRWHLRYDISMYWWIVTPLVKIGNFFGRVTSKFDGWPWKTIGQLFYTTSSIVHHLKVIGKFKVKLQSGRVQFGSKSAIFCPVWPWNLMDDLEQGKSEGFDSYDRPCNLTQIGFKSSIFQPVWPWNLMDDLEKL